MFFVTGAVGFVAAGFFENLFGWRLRSLVQEQPKVLRANDSMRLLEEEQMQLGRWQSREARGWMWKLSLKGWRSWP